MAVFPQGPRAPPAFDPPDLLQVTDLRQEQVARTLGEGHRVIHGAAGSGKTMILIFRAQPGRRRARGGAQLPARRAGRAPRRRLLRTTGRHADARGRNRFVPGGQYTALRVLHDDTQPIYQQRRKRFSFASVGIDAVGRTHILKLNDRNTAEVLALALHCAQSLLDGAPKPSWWSNASRWRAASCRTRAWPSPGSTAPTGSATASSC